AHASCSAGYGLLKRADVIARDDPGAGSLPLLAMLGRDEHLAPVSSGRALALHSRRLFATAVEKNNVTLFVERGNERFTALDDLVIPRLGNREFAFERGAF